MMIDSTIAARSHKLMIVVTLHRVLTRSGNSLFLLTLLLILANQVQANSASPLFSEHSLIEATIKAPFKKIMRERNKEEETDGTFTYIGTASQQIQFDIKLQIRGNYRARKDVCKFAPLRLNFKKGQVDGTEFDGADKIKLITHCNSANNFMQYILKEYLNYRFLQEITENSFRTRLLRITYVDTEGNGKSLTKYGILIEHQKQLAKRLGENVTEIQRIKLDQLDRAQTNLVAVFSYFVANTDYSSVRGANGEPCCHNVTLIEHEPGRYLPIPYDFDLSGMVNAVYATPNPKHRIAKVTTRLYLGWCQNNELLDGTLTLFRDKRAEITALVASIDGLNNYSRKNMTSYIDRFYKTIAREERIKSQFIKKCS